MAAFGQPIDDHEVRRKEQHDAEHDVNAHYDALFRARNILKPRNATHVMPPAHARTAENGRLLMNCPNSKPPAAIFAV